MRLRNQGALSRTCRSHFVARVPGPDSMPATLADRCADLRFPPIGEREPGGFALGSTTMR